MAYEMKRELQVVYMIVQSYMGQLMPCVVLSQHQHTKLPLTLR